MADIELSVQGSYRRVEYTVTLIGSTLGQERWTFRANIHQLDHWVAGDTFVSPGFYCTDAEAHQAAIEVVELYIDRQWKSRITL